MKTIVYRYGLRFPTCGVDAALEQLAASHRYRNQLVELERTRRAKLRAAESKDSAVAQRLGAMQGAQTKLDEALEAAKRSRSSSAKTASRAVSAEHRAAIAAARAVLKETRKAWRDAKAEARDRIAPVCDAINAEALAARKAARAKCGVYWGTYQLVEDADQAARKAPLWMDGEPNDPRFQRYTGEGDLSVQISDGVGLSVSDLAKGTQVMLRECDAEDRRIDGSRRKALRRRCDLWLRVGSDAAKAPVWAVWPMIQHRPLPAGARIKRVTVHRRTIGPRVKWHATFTINVPEPERRCWDGIVAIDIGWRARPDGSLRVAQSFAPDGPSPSEREFTLPREIISALKRADTLRSTRDQNFDEMRRVLFGWIRETRSMPGWFLDDVETLPSWKSQNRLAALAIKWREQRFSGDNAMFDAVDGWRKQDKHLWCWEDSQRAKSLGRRRDYYRVAAAKLAENFDTLILEDFDLSVVSRRPAIGDAKEADYIEQAARNRTLAAVAAFRGALINAFRMRGGSVHKVDPANTTRECHVCGVVETFDAASKLRHTCVNGHEWDQDENAARNIYERWRRAQDTATARSEEESVPAEARWARAKRMKRERDERMDRSKGEAV